MGGARYGRALGFLFALVMAAPAGAVVTGSDIDELKNSEQEQELRLKALRKRVEVLSRNVRDKSKAYHSLKSNSGVAAFIWEDEGSAVQKNQNLERMLQVAIREDLKEVQNLEAQEGDLRAELEWVRLRLTEALTRPAAPEAAEAAPVVVREVFRCDDLPVEAADGKALSLIQDFGVRKDVETGIEWRSLGWWIGHTGHVVRACASGTVVFSGRVPGRGRVGVLDHGDGGMTLYANLNDDNEYTYRKGDGVKAGAVLGSPRDKLYFEARRNGSAVNPRDVLPAPHLAKSGL